MSAKVEKTGSCSFCGQTKIIQVPEDVVNLLIATVDAIEDKHMKGITVDVGHGVKAKVSKMAKESIKVERSENKKTTYEE